MQDQSNHKLLLTKCEKCCTLYFQCLGFGLQWRSFKYQKQLCISLGRLILTITQCEASLLINLGQFSNITGTVEPRLMTTLLIRPPRYYGHFILTRKRLTQSFSYLKNPFNMTTPLIRPVFHGPKVVVLTGFQCMYYLAEIYYCRRTYHKLLLLSRRCRQSWLLCWKGILQLQLSTVDNLYKYCS